MGHTRLGQLPKTRKWKAVVAALGSIQDDAGTSEVGGAASASVAEVARRTLEAAGEGLQAAKGDNGLRLAVFLLTQIAVAGREPTTNPALVRAGIDVTAAQSLFDLNVQVQRAIDRHLSNHGQPTDASEMAQQAMGEAIASLADSGTLFGGPAETVSQSLRGVSTKEGFARLGHKFFASFMARYLSFYLSRATAASVGSGSIDSVGSLSDFNDALALHCEQSARIVREFCGAWYSKTRFTEGITQANTNRFLAVAMKKLQAEMQHQGAQS